MQDNNTINDTEQLNEQLTVARQEAENYKKMFEDISNSKLWRLVKPLRAIKYILLSLKIYGLSDTVRRIKSGKFSYAELSVIDYQKKFIRKNLPHVKPTVKFSILVPLYNTENRFLIKMIKSVLNQKYNNFELILADASDDAHSYVATTVEKFAKKDRRIIYKKLDVNYGISGNTNKCAEMATGDYIALLDHDDILGEYALLYNAYYIKKKKADVLYSDEDHIDEDGNHKNPFFKPDWSPDLLYSQMYICHFLVIKKSLFNKIGGFREEFSGSQDYDLMLRLSENTDKIFHIAKILYSWRECETSTAANADSKPYAHNAGKCALDAHLKRKYGNIARACDSGLNFVYEARFDTLKNNPLVSIIMPMKDHSDLSELCIKSIVEKSSYKNYEILIINNRSEQDETFKWFNEIKKFDKRIRVIDADFEFNWSKINNFGIKNANGDIYIFLNNDTVVISQDWIEKLCENAMRDDIGVVGAKLFYDDDTIQHAGVVVGMGGWADHVFKGMQPIHYGSPFVSPEVSRNVSAVTGACMAISKKTIEKIGGFDERFIICGSDVEICLRAVKFGFYNLYNSRVMLYHLESKSRDSYIPEIDFKLSAVLYEDYVKNGDPFFNENLDNYSPVPTPKYAFSFTGETANLNEYRIPELRNINGRKTEIGEKIRLNLIVPSVDKTHVFGGIATAIKFFKQLVDYTGFDARIITTDAVINKKTMIELEGFQIIGCDTDLDYPKQLVDFCNRNNRTIPIRHNDVFLVTAWWTAYNIADAVRWQAKVYDKEIGKLLYFIQDYEPGFYPWSSKYLLSESTYKMNIPTVAFFNSRLLKNYFDRHGYKFYDNYYFEPVLNDSLKAGLLNNSIKNVRKKQIIIYGRPSVSRNAFEVIVLALKLWAEKQKDINDWTIVSAGEQFDDIKLKNGVCIHSVGKLSLKEYANLMLDSYAAISLMVSPHPSYPPLEMSTFGVKTITNGYDIKNLSSFNKNIISLDNCSPNSISEKLCEICDGFKPTPSSEDIITEGEYLKSDDVFNSIIKDLAQKIGDEYL